MSITILNIADTLHLWCRENRTFALATLVQVSDNTPLPPGTALAVDTEGNVVGSISGGCVDGAICELCCQIIETNGLPIRRRFDYSDVFAVGLSSGGKIDVLVQRIQPVDQPQLIAALDAVRSADPPPWLRS